jgi:hypothetical protein
MRGEILQNRSRVYVFKGPSCAGADCTGASCTQGTCTGAGDAHRANCMPPRSWGYFVMAKRSRNNDLECLIDHREWSPSELNIPGSQYRFREYTLRLFSLSQ